ncbi:Hypothetical protein, putative [Bodo saltans]|uniref:Uncharacterized protein n=1 Tax=Bodo saltans TaxID=75058 RepID=A0A0S4JJ32_BODSA|nr:Hypothetical protein, putative [Bodo saltans]|eukprot:CUG90176.1 Hypothetical protein, putative [Bodo saltans]
MPVQRRVLAFDTRLLRRLPLPWNKFPWTCAYLFFHLALSTNHTPTLSDRQQTNYDLSLHLLTEPCGNVSLLALFFFRIFVLISPYRAHTTLWSPRHETQTKDVQSSIVLTPCFPFSRRYNNSIYAHECDIVMAVAAHLCFHAQRLSFIHPLFFSPLPRTQIFPKDKRQRSEKKSKSAHAYGQDYFPFSNGKRLLTPVCCTRYGGASRNNKEVRQTPIASVSIKSSVNHQNGDSASTLVGSSLRSLRGESSCEEHLPVAIVTAAIALSGASSFDPCPPVEPRKIIRASRPPPHTAATLSMDAFHEDDGCEDDAQESSDATAASRVDDAFGAMPPTEEDDSAGHARSPSSNSWGWSGCGQNRPRRDTLNDNNTSSQDCGPKSATQSLDVGDNTSGSATNPPGSRPHPPSSQRGSFSGSDARSLMFSRNGSLRDVSLSIVSSLAHLQQQEKRNTNPKKQTLDDGESHCASESTISSERAAEKSHERSEKAMRKPAETYSATVSSALTSGSSLDRLPALPAKKDSHVVPPLAPVPSGTGSTRRSFRRTPLKKIDATAFKSVTFMSSDNSPLTPPIRSFGAVLQPSPRPGTNSISSRGLLPPPPLRAISPKPPVPVAWRISPSSPRAIRSEPLVRVAQAAEFGAMFFSAQAANTDATNTTDENADSITGEPALTHTQQYCAWDILALSAADADECCHPQQQQPLPPIDTDAAGGPSVSSSYPLQGSSYPLQGSTALLSASFLPSVVVAVEGELTEHQPMERDEYDEAPRTLNIVPVPSLPAQVVANMDDEVCEHNRSVDAMIAIQLLVAETTLPFLGESHHASTALF